MRRECLHALLVASLVVPAVARGDQAASFAEGDVFVAWQARQGLTVAYRGVPVVTANPSEFIVHEKWQKVHYRSENGAPSATAEEKVGETVLTISDADEHFRWQKRVTVRRDSIRMEWEYELLDPQEAEIQVLFGVGGKWLGGATYSLTAAGKSSNGKLDLPKSGRTDPWADATQQRFATDYGVLTVRSDRGINLLCLPEGGSYWWAEKLRKGDVRHAALDVTVEPGPASNTGLRLTGLVCPKVVDSPRARLQVGITREEDGPPRVELRALPGGDPVTVDLTTQPTKAECAAPVERNGLQALTLTAIDPATGRELLRIAPVFIEVKLMLQARPRLSYYMTEPEAEIVLDCDVEGASEGLTAQVEIPGTPLVSAGIASARVLVPLDISGLPQGTHVVTCRLMRGADQVATAETRLTKLAPRPNAVQIDNTAHGLIVGGLPFIPFGFYTYYPLKAGIIDQEVVNGFNLLSPYHGGPHTAEQLAPIREYLDRCAQVGMKVNYHVMWSNRADMTDDDWASLKAEVEAFRDHPALLCWYIADEPSLDQAPHLEKVKQTVGELDPYHPVTVVFYQGAEHAKRFMNAMDIVMADPYPIPDGPVTRVSEMSDAIRDAFDDQKPLWIVPQAFGGNEWWRREPTAREQRAMTYLALLHGARGIQYFIRSPYSSFPKSPAMWGECSRLALETAELTPVLTSAELAPPVTCSEPLVQARSFLDRGMLYIVAVNTDRAPRAAEYHVEGVDYTGDADVVFEDRKAPVNAGMIEEPIDGCGTRVYAIPVGPLPIDAQLESGDNLVYDGSWEDCASVGTPSGCYAGTPDGATSLVDSRLAVNGRHSLRMTAPSDGALPRISPFPVSAKGGTEYRVSIWAKAATDGVMLQLTVGDEHEFPLTTEWQEYSFTWKPTEDGRVGPTIRLGSAGTAWLDLFQVVAAG